MPDTKNSQLPAATTVAGLELYASQAGSSKKVPVALIMPNASTTQKGDVQLASNGEADPEKAVSSTDSRLSDARPPTAHGHTIAAISGLAEALDGKQASLPNGTANQYLRGDKTFQSLNKSAVGLPNVDDTPDAEKPVSNPQQTALNKLRTRSIGFIFDGAGSVLTAALSQFIRAPWDGTITKALIMADQVGSANVDIWEDSWANFPPTIADSKTTLALSSAQKAESGTLSIAVVKGDVLACNLTAPSAIRRLVVQLEVTLN